MISVGLCMGIIVRIGVIATIAATVSLAGLLFQSIMRHKKKGKLFQSSNKAV